MWYYSVVHGRSLDLGNNRGFEGVFGSKGKVVDLARFWTIFKVGLGLAIALSKQVRWTSWVPRTRLKVEGNLVCGGERWVQG